MTTFTNFEFILVSCFSVNVGFGVVVWGTWAISLLVLLSVSPAARCMGWMHATRTQNIGSHVSVLHVSL